MGIDILREIAFDDFGGGCAKILTPDGSEKDVGFQALVPIDPNGLCLF